MRKILLLGTALIFSILVAYGQDRVVSGTVTDGSDNSSLPGVSVLLKGTSTGTATDANGQFNLNVQPGAVLVFSFIGYVTKEVEVGSNAVLNVSLETDVQQLNEVVITAVGIESNVRKLGYAAQSVEAADIIKSQQTNVVNGLAGRAAGVQIHSSNGMAGASSAIRIRGSASIDGNNDPLFVVDGIPISNEENPSGNPDDASNQFLDGVANSNRAIDINPNDIESVTILKGGAATALYGIRAANGAVIITTKRGSDTKGRPVITFSSTLGTSRISQMPELQTKYSQGSNGVHANPGNTSLPPSDVNSGSNDRHSWGALIADLRYKEGTGGLYGWDPNGRLVDKNDPTASGVSANVYDNIGNFFRSGSQLENNLSFALGNENTQYYFSVGNRQEEGVVPNNDFQRTSIKGTISSRMGDRFKSTFSVNYINSGGNRQQQGSNLSGVMLGLLRTPATFDNSFGYGADAVNNRDAYMFPDGTQRAYRGLSDFGTRTLQAIYDNPFFTVSENSLVDNVNRFIGFAQLDFEVMEDVTLTYRAGTDFFNDRRKTVMAIGSLNLGNGEGFLTDDAITHQDINSDLYLNIRKELSDEVSLTATLGHNYFSRKDQRFYVQGIDLSIPGFYHITNTVTQLTRNVNTNKKTAAVYADLSLGFRDYLFLGLTGRNEWSSTLPKDNNSFFYPSVNIGFIFSEALDIENSFLNYGKLRAAYSVLGNDAQEYLTATTYYTPNVADGWVNTGLNFPYNGVNAVSRSTILGNSELKPEKLTSIEFGTDLRLLSNRIGLDVTWYKNTSVDQIIQVPIDPSTGYRNVALNAGEIENKGWEVAVLSTPVQIRDFTWNLDVNFTRNRSEVLKLAPGVDVIQLVGFSSTSSRAIVGQGYGAIYGQDFVRNDQGQMIIGADGYPTLDNNSKYLGDPNPDWIAGISNTISYKTLSFSFLWDIRQGGDIWNGTRGALVTMGTAKETEDRGEMFVFPGVLADGTPNSKEVPLDESWYRGIGGGFSGNAVDYVEDAGWIRLRNVSLSYSLSPTLLQSLPFSNVTLTATANNLLLFTKYNGVDPETSLVGSGNGFGAIDYFNMPGIKSYNFGLKATF